MSNTQDVSAPPRRPSLVRRVGKYAVRALIVLAVSGAGAHAYHTYSGSGNWESLGERKGVTVYAMKVPGDNLLKFKAVWKMRTTLNRFVAFAQDENFGKQLGFYDIRKFDFDAEKFKRGEQLRFHSAWKDSFSPFTPREFVIENDFSQDPGTKAVTFTVSARPQFIPPDPCCVRVAVMNNHWRLTPRKTGEIDVEWLLDMDIDMPYFMANREQPKYIYYFARRVEGYVNRDNFKDAKYDWVDESAVL